MSSLQLTQTPTSLTFRKRLPAPVALVFTTLSEAAHVARWWGPPGCPVTECAIDFRVGGEWRYAIKAGNELHHALAIYRDIHAPVHLVFDDFMTTPAGEIIPELPNKHVEIDLTDAGDATIMTVTVSLETPAELTALTNMGFVEGFTGALTLLEKEVNDNRGDQQ